MIRGDAFINIYAQVKVCSSENENVTSAPEFLRTSEWFKRDAAPIDRTIDDLRANIAAMEGKSEPLYEEINKLQISGGRKDEKEVCMEKIFRFRKLFVRSKQIWLSPTKIKIA